MSLLPESCVLSSCSVTPVSGGITNALYLFKPSYEGSSPLLVRLFGGEGMIDRDTETDTYAEMCAYLGRITYLGRFGNGRVEGFLEGFKACTLEEVRRVALPRVALGGALC